MPVLPRKCYLSDRTHVRFPSEGNHSTHKALKQRDEAPTLISTPGQPLRKEVTKLRHKSLPYMFYNKHKLDQREKKVLNKLIGVEVLKKLPVYFKICRFITMIFEILRRCRCSRLVVTPCRFVNRHYSSGGNYSLHVEG